jgi:hypothetical protein
MCSSLFYSSVIVFWYRKMMVKNITDHHYLTRTIIYGQQHYMSHHNAINGQHNHTVFLTFFMKINIWISFICYFDLLCCLSINKRIILLSSSPNFQICTGTMDSIQLSYIFSCIQLFWKWIHQQFWCFHFNKFSYYYFLFCMCYVYYGTRPLFSRE